MPVLAVNSHDVWENVLSKRMRNAVIAVFFAAAPNVGLADCAKIAPGSVVCIDTDTDGFEDESASNLTVILQPGAVVDGHDGITLEGEARSSVFNFGYIITNDEGIVGGQGLTVTNNGLIEAGDKGIDADEADDVAVWNFATIKAGDKAIRIGDGDNAVVFNAGLIFGGDEAVEAGDNAQITNAQGGEIISSEDDGVQVGENAVIANAGVIISRGGEQDAIDLDSGVIQNFAGALITSETDAAIDFDESKIPSEINNYGTIKGVLGVLVEKDPTEGANVASQTVENWGRIEGTGGTALDLGAGNDVYIHHAGAELVGVADFGAGADRLVIDARLKGLFTGGAVVAGGSGADTVILPHYRLDELRKVTVAGDVTSLFFKTGQINLSGWETYEFSGTKHSLTDIQNAN